MKRRFAIIMAALLIAAMAGCSQSGTSSTAEQSTVQSSADSSVAESAESEISEAESSVVSEVTSTESSEEKSETSAAESSENKSKTESSKPKNEESSKPENSKAETSKTETSKPVESSKPEESSNPEESSTPSKKPEESSNPSKKPEESSTPSKKPEESSTPSSTPKQEVKATGITLDLSSLSLTSGSTQELNAYILWSNGTSSYNGITWSTSNNGVATVSSSGYVTAKSAGTATITASYGSYSKSCTVTVKAAQSSQPSGGGNGGNGGSSGNGGNGGSGNGGSTSKPSDGGNGGAQTQPSTPTITIKYRNDAAIEVGKENYVRPSVYKGNEMLAGAAGNYNITYKSSNTSVATVDSDGFVKGISQGTCTITATYGSSTTTCTVTVKAASGSGSGGGSSQTGDQSSKATEWYSADGNWYCNNIHPNIGDKVTIKYIGKYDRIHGSSHVVRDRMAYKMLIEHGSLYNKTQNALTVSFTVKDPGYFNFEFYKLKTDERGNIIEDWIYPYDKLRFDVNANETYDEYYYDEFGNRYSTTWVESEHEAFKTKTRKGYTIWECPEMVTIINEYRAKEGKSPLYWYSSDKAKQEDIEFMKKRGDTQFFNSDGSVDWDAYYKYWGVGQGCRDNCEYHMDGHSDPHGSNYSSNVAECVHMSTGKYGVRRAVEGWMNSPAHRAYIMKLEGSVYICHNGKFFYLS